MQRRSEHGVPVPFQFVPRPTATRRQRRRFRRPSPAGPHLPVRRRPVRVVPGRFAIVEPEQFQRRRRLPVASQFRQHPRHVQSTSVDSAGGGGDRYQWRRQYTDRRRSGCGGGGGGRQPPAADRRGHGLRSPAVRLQRPGDVAVVLPASATAPSAPASRVRPEQLGGTADGPGPGGQDAADRTRTVQPAAAVVTGDPRGEPADVDAAAPAATPAPANRS